MPRSWAGSIRVAHPCATLGTILLSSLPSGLHVLGLPLAFILSQDQTLHSIIFGFDGLAAIAPDVFVLALALPVMASLQFADPSRLLGPAVLSFIYSMNVLALYQY